VRAAAKVVSFFRTTFWGRLTEDDWKDDDQREQVWPAAVVTATRRAPHSFLSHRPESRSFLDGEREYTSVIASAFTDEKWTCLP